MKTKSHETTADLAAYRAIDLIYHSYLTGLILMLSSRAGPQRAADIAFRTFRRQQVATIYLRRQRLEHEGSDRYWRKSVHFGSVSLRLLSLNERLWNVRFWG